MSELSSYEGDLMKYANVLKGYQKRFFSINTATSELSYFISENMRHKAAKGIIQLTNAVVLQSDDDETLFTIHTFENNKHRVSYLKASSLEERSNWLRALKPTANPEINNLEAISTQSSPNQCSICLDNAKQAVVTLCGHLFCKECINQWIELKPIGQTCPVCNKGISKQKIVRLYGINEDVDRGVDGSVATTTVDELSEIQSGFINDSETRNRAGSQGGRLLLRTISNFFTHVNGNNIERRLVHEDLPVVPEPVVNEVNENNFEQVDNYVSEDEARPYPVYYPPARPIWGNTFTSLNNCFFGTPVVYGNGNTFGQAIGNMFGNIFLAIFWIAIAGLIVGVIFFLVTTFLVFLISPKLAAVYVIIIIIFLTQFFKSKANTRN